MDTIIIIISAYLLGSLNFAIVFSKWFMKKDIREYGSRNAGTTNVLRVMGKKWALVVLLCDIFKAVAAVSIGGAIGGNIGKLIAGGVVIIGHIYPLYFKFKGGKGVATAAGMLLAFDLRMFAILVIIFFTVLYISKFVSLSSMAAGAFLPFGMYIFYKDSLFVLTGILIFLGIIYMHRTNIVRIVNHEENKFSFKKKRG